MIRHEKVSELPSSSQNEFQNSANPRIRGCVRPSIRPSIHLAGRNKGGEQFMLNCRFATLTIGFCCELQLYKRLCPSVSDALRFYRGRLKRM